MPNVKDELKELIRAQPDDATCDEIMRELACERMIEQGLADARSGRVLSNGEMERGIRTSGE